jgi:hypothetical protein
VRIMSLRGACVRSDELQVLAPVAAGFSVFSCHVQGQAHVHCMHAGHTSAARCGTRQPLTSALERLRLNSSGAHDWMSSFTTRTHTRVLWSVAAVKAGGSLRAQTASQPHQLDVLSLLRRVVG